MADVKEQPAGILRSCVPVLIDLKPICNLQHYSTLSLSFGQPPIIAWLHKKSKVHIC